MLSELFEGSRIFLAPAFMPQPRKEVKLNLERKAPASTPRETGVFGRHGKTRAAHRVKRVQAVSDPGWTLIDDRALCSSCVNILSIH